MSDARASLVAHPLRPLRTSDRRELESPRSFDLAVRTRSWGVGSDVRVEAAAASGTRIASARGMLRAVSLVVGLVVSICAACGGEAEANPADDPNKCFWSDAKLRDSFARSGSGIYGATTVSSCAAHCPPNFAAFCEDPGAMTATSKAGTKFPVVGLHGAYSLQLAPGDYDVCHYQDCIPITLSPGEFRRIDAEAAASPGGWFWQLRLR